MATEISISQRKRKITFDVTSSTLKAWAEEKIRLRSLFLLILIEKKRDPNDNRRIQRKEKKRKTLL
jgi:hypothetical protein